MKRLFTSIAIALAAFTWAIADTPETTPDDSTDLVISKDSKKRPGLPGRSVIHCAYYSDGTLCFTTDVEYQILTVTVSCDESGLCLSAVITPDNPTLFIGTRPGTYQIEARTDGNQIFKGSLSI